MNAMREKYAAFIRGRRLIIFSLVSAAFVRGRRKLERGVHASNYGILIFISDFHMSGQRQN